MKKLFSSILALGLALCLSLGMVACNGNHNNDGGDETPSTQTVTYTITVTCPEGDEATLDLINVALKKDGAVAAEKALGSDHKATFALEAGTYTVTLTEKFEGALANYTYTDDMVTATSLTATIALARASDKPIDEPDTTIEYTVTVLLPDGTPVVGVMAQLCGGPIYQCYPKTTNESGVATWKLEPGFYELHIAPEQANYPAGYHFDDDKYTMDETGGSITVYFEVAEPAAD